MRSEFKPALVALSAALLVCAPTIVRPQTQTDPPRAFGSSLKREKKEGKGGEDADKPEDVLRVDTTMVVLDVSVMDPSGRRYITGLTRDDFVVQEDGRPQEVASFTLGDDAARLPRSIILIFDRSQSQLAFIDTSVEAAKKLISQLAPEDEMAIVTDDVELSIGFTKDRKLLRRGLDNFRKWTKEGYRTRSMQFSALLATLRDLVDNTGRKRPIIILQTDGDEVNRLSPRPVENGGQNVPTAYGMNDVYAEIERSRVRVYTVIPNERIIGLPEQEMRERARNILQRLRTARSSHKDMWYGAERLPPKPSGSPTDPKMMEAITQWLKETREHAVEQSINNLIEGETAAARVAELSGGWASFLERPEQADEIYARILADINRSYVIGYYPTNKTPDGTLRRVRLEVKGHPEYVIQGRNSYYAEKQ